MKKFIKHGGVWMVMHQWAGFFLFPEAIDAATYAIWKDNSGGFERWHEKCVAALGRVDWWGSGVRYVNRYDHDRVADTLTGIEDPWNWYEDWKYVGYRVLGYDGALVTELAYQLLGRGELEDLGAMLAQIVGPKKS